MVFYPFSKYTEAFGLVKFFLAFMRDLKKVIKVTFRSVVQLKYKNKSRKSFLFQQLKRAKFQQKTCLKKLRLHFIFFLLVSRLISIMAGKLSQHMAVSSILFKKIFGGNLKLKLVRNRTLFYF